MKRKRSTRKRKVWIDGWYDPLAGINARSHNICLSDVMSKGDYYIVFGNSRTDPGSSIKDRNILRIFKGTDCVNETRLLDNPISVKDYLNIQRRIIVAVATCSSIYLFDQCNPYYKFILPPIEVSNVENQVWVELGTGAKSISDGYEELLKLKKTDVPLTKRSLEFLGIGNKTSKSKKELILFVEERKKYNLLRTTTLTCMDVLHKTKDLALSPGVLVFGTENKRIHFLDDKGHNVDKTVILNGVPAILGVKGSLDQDYRIFVACRNGTINMIRNGELSGVEIQMDSPIVDIKMIGVNCVVGTKNRRITCFTKRGKRIYSLYLPSQIQCMEILELKLFRGTKCLIVALKNKDLRIYNGKHLINTVQTPDNVLGMKFGMFGTEPSSLILVYQHGGFGIKYISRKAQLESKVDTEPPKEQQIPLVLPKKSRLYLEQSEREKEFGKEIHRRFQKELCKLRLKSAKTFVKILTDGQGSFSEISGSEMNVSVELKGVGPTFAIRLKLKNNGSRNMLNIPVSFNFDDDLYNMVTNKFVIPNMIPHLEYIYEVKVSYIGDGESCDRIYCYILHSKRIVPIITAVIQMPLVAKDEVEG